MKRVKSPSAILLALVAGSAFGGKLHVTVIDEAGKPLQDAAVFLESQEPRRTVKPLANVELVQKDRTFMPAVLIVPTGSSVSFPNRDTVRHHVYSFSPAKRFELKLYVGTPATPIVFDQPGVVVTGCNIHDHMIAHILVVDTPFYGTASGRGLVTMHDVPTGQYDLKVWHSRLPVGTPVHTRVVKLGTADTVLEVALKGLRPQ